MRVLRVLTLPGWFTVTLCVCSSIVPTVWRCYLLFLVLRVLLSVWWVSVSLHSSPWEVSPFLRVASRSPKLRLEPFPWGRWPPRACCPAQLYFSPSRPTDASSRGPVERPDAPPSPPTHPQLPLLPLPMHPGPTLLGKGFIAVGCGFVIGDVGLRRGERAGVVW